MKRIALLHYAVPPTVGGVESTIGYQARGLARLGYPVRVIGGVGAPFAEDLETIIEPLFSSTHSDVLRVKAELDAGQITPAFQALCEQLTELLRAALRDCQICIAHNIPTFNKNLPLTTALKTLSDEGVVRVVAWCHDLAWTNAQYQPELHPGVPWALLRTAWQGAAYVTISTPRRDDLAALLDISTTQIQVITGGIDPALFFRWSSVMQEIVAHYGLLKSDGIFLLPARITRRKNIELGLHILAQLREQTRKDYRLIVTGPPGPHNPSNPGYLGELLALRAALRLEDAAHFLYALGSVDTPFIPDEETMASLYQFADALLFPSLQEGFGLPILEAGLAGIPIFGADLPPLRETGGADLVYFDPHHDPPEKIASEIERQLLANSAFRLRVRVRQHYRWEALIREQLVPLLESL
jgi:glycosyltransferase involved in cell wall biosynthesis